MKTAVDYKSLRKIVDEDLIFLRKRLLIVRFLSKTKRLFRVLGCTARRRGQRPLVMLCRQGKARAGSYGKTKKASRRLPLVSE